MHGTHIVPGERMYIIWLIVMLLAFPLTGGEMTFSVGTPVFDKPSAEAKILMVLPEDRQLEISGGGQRVWFHSHPLVRYADYYKADIPGQGECYISPDIRLDPVSGELRLLKEVPVAGRLLLPVSLGILLFLCYRLYRFPGDRENAWIYTGVVIAVRAALLSYILCMAGAIVCNPADEPGYFAVGYDLLQGKCMGPWSYPVGYGVLMMMPWIIFTGAKSFFDIAVGISWFSGFVLGSAALLLAFRLLLALRMPVKTVFTAVLTWAMLPFFVHHIPDWDTLTFYNMVDLPSVRAGFRFYMQLIGSGFNGMSDMFSTVLVFAVLLLAMRMPVKTCFLILVAVLFGTTCLVRLNNIFFAPVLALILVERFMPRLKTWQNLAMFLLVGGASFMATAGIQLAVNYLQFGDAWTFPYSLHAVERAAGDRPADGFTFATLLKGTNLRYLLESNLGVMSCAVAGLILMQERRLRAMLGLWALPVILFFCGYSHTFCDAVRFILSAYIPLLAAAVWVPVKVWQNKDWRRGGIYLAMALILMVWHNGWVLFGMLVLLLIRAIVDAVCVLCEAGRPQGAITDKTGIF